MSRRTYIQSFDWQTVWNYAKSVKQQLLEKFPEHTDEINTFSYNFTGNGFVIKKDLLIGEQLLEKIKEHFPKLISNRP